jgi:hypothetical protein
MLLQGKHASMRDRHYLCTKVMALQRETICYPCEKILNQNKLRNIWRKQKKKVNKLNGTFFFPQEAQNEKEREEIFDGKDDFIFV